ncbi:MAG: GNAT family N-acetyltransferase [Acutalibacteraceae bacterium]
MLNIRYVKNSDKAFWFSLDKHLSEAEFANKVNTKRGYVMLENDKPIGLLRYNLFWDNTPFCTMLYIDYECQKNGIWH